MPERFYKSLRAEDAALLWRVHRDLCELRDIAVDGEQARDLAGRLMAAFEAGIWSEAVLLAKFLDDPATPASMDQGKTGNHQQ